jgi:hypothetical protein
MSFPGEEAVMMIYDECPSPGRCHVPNRGLRTPARYGLGCGNMEM